MQALVVVAMLLGAAGPGGAAAEAVAGTLMSCTELVCPGGPHCEEQLGPARIHGADALVGYDVNVGTGNLHLSVTDVVVFPALGPALRFERHYNSQSAVSDAGLGRGWTHSYSWRAVWVDAYHVTIRTNTGRTIPFTRVSTWNPPAGEFGSLSVGDKFGVSTFTDKFGTRYSFDTWANSGRLLSITPPDNTAITVSYASGTNIHRVTSGDLSLTFDYGGANIGEVSDPAGNVWAFRYSTGNVLSEVTLPNVDANGVRGAVYYSYADVLVNGTWFYADGASRLTRVQSLQSNGVVIDRGLYSHSGRKLLRAASSSAGASLQNDVSFMYALCTDAPSMTRVTFAGGEKYVTSRPVSGYQRIEQVDANAGSGFEGLEWTNAEYSWNSDLTLASMTDGNGVITTYSNYDAKGNPRTIVEGSGSAIAKTTTFTYHSVLSRPLTVSRLSVDGMSQHTVTYDYDADYDTGYNAAPTNFVHQTVESGKTDTALVGSPTTPVTYASKTYYDAQNRVTQSLGPNGNSVWSSYWPAGSPNNASNRLQSNWVRTLGAATLTSSFSKYDMDGRLTASQDANGATTTVTYDPVGRVLSRSTASGGASATHTWAFDLAGELLTHVTPEGTTVKYEYDAASRAWRQHAETVGGASTPWSKVFTFNDQGRVTAIRRFAGLGSTQASTCASSGAEEFCEERAYDAFRRLQKIRTLSSTDTACTGNACAITFAYDSNGSLQSTTEVGLHTTSYLRDALNRVTRVTLPTGRYATLAYDINDNIKARWDPRSSANGGGGGERQADYTHDDFGRILSVNTADTGLMIANFDGAGLQVAAKDARGNVLTYHYDQANRLTDITSPNASETVAYLYDETGSIGGVPYANTAGRPTSVLARAPDWSRISSHYSYDQFGQVSDVIEERGPDASPAFFNSHYSWLPNGELASLTYPDGKVLTFTFDNPRGYAPTPKPDSATVVFNGANQSLFYAAGYFGDGVVSSLTYGNGSTRALTRNHRDEWTRLVSGPAGSRVVEQRYERDTDGRGLVTAVHHYQGEFNAFDWTFSYDSMNRLTGYATNVRPTVDSYAWTYDEVGNRASEVFNGETTTYNYPSNNNNQLGYLSGAEVGAWAYNANGYVATHVAGLQNHRYDYDTRNLLAQIWDENARHPAALYQYDGSLRLAQRTEYSTSYWVQYFYDLSGRLLQEREYGGEQANGDAVYGITDHVYLSTGAEEVARIKTQQKRPCTGCDYVYVDDDIEYVHEDFRRGPFGIESLGLGGLGWMVEMLPFGDFKNVGLPGPDGKPGTSDDLPAGLTNLLSSMKGRLDGTDNGLRDPLGRNISSPALGSLQYPSTRAVFSREGLSSYLPGDRTKSTLESLAGSHRGVGPGGIRGLDPRIGGEADADTDEKAGAHPDAPSGGTIVPEQNRPHVDPGEEVQWFDKRTEFERKSDGGMIKFEHDGFKVVRPVDAGGTSKDGGGKPGKPIILCSGEGDCGPSSATWLPLALQGRGPNITARRGLRSRPANPQDDDGLGIGGFNPNAPKLELDQREPFRPNEPGCPMNPDALEHQIGTGPIVRPPEGEPRVVNPDVPR